MGLLVNTQLLSKGIRAEFIKGLEVAPTAVPLLATVIPSDKSSEDYAWLGEAPAMREFLDERSIKDLSDAKYNIVNKTWENTLGVKRTELEDDQTSTLPTRVRDLAARCRQHADELLFHAVLNGATGLGYDGAAFYSAHPARGEQTATQSNTAAGTGVTVAALKTDVQAAIQTMLTFKDERNKPFWPAGLNPANLIVICPPQISFNMREAINATVISNTTNILVGQVSDVLVIPWLATGANGVAGDANDWHLFYTGGAVKPLIFQERMPPELEALEGQADAGFMRDTFFYGGRGRWNAGYGIWQAAFRTTN